MAVQASIPPRLGIRTSIRTMSGSRSAALSTASAPSPASPTTWMSSSWGQDDLQSTPEERVVVHDEDPNRLLARFAARLTPVRTDAMVFTGVGHGPEAVRHRSSP